MRIPSWSNPLLGTEAAKPIRDSKNRQGIQVIASAAEILRTLGKHRDGLSLRHIASKMSLPRSTGQGAGDIRLGPGIQSLAEFMRQDLAQNHRTVIETIRQDTGETVDLAILRGECMLFTE